MKRVVVEVKGQAGDAWKQTRMTLFSIWIPSCTLRSMTEALTRGRGTERERGNAPSTKLTYGGEHRKREEGDRPSDTVFRNSKFIMTGEPEHTKLQADVYGLARVNPNIGFSNKERTEVQSLTKRISPTSRSSGPIQIPNGQFLSRNRRSKRYLV